MNTPYPRITGWGKYLPSRVLTNAELERMVETSDEWIFARTGIRERRIASEAETAAAMATAAARDALDVAGVAADDVDLVIVATTTPDNVMPAVACAVQAALGARHAAAFDLNAACSGFVYGLVVASQFIAAGGYRRVLVIGSEVFSRLIDWSDRNTCVLFGDGAGAVLVEADTESGGPFAFVLGSDGSGANALHMPASWRPLTELWTRDTSMSEPPRFIQMDGPEIFKFAVTIMARVTLDVVAAAGMDLDDIALFIPHQANDRIIAAAARALRLPRERFFVNLDHYGNTSAASVPIALCEAVATGRLRCGDRVVMVGFGGGLTWAAVVMEWRPRQSSASDIAASEGR